MVVDCSIVPAVHFVPFLVDRHIDGMTSTYVMSKPYHFRSFETILYIILAIDLNEKKYMSWSIPSEIPVCITTCSTS